MLDTIMGGLSAVFWGLVVLSLLVFVHEGGHYLAARACGVRVTEFFLGMPSRLKLSFRSKRNGTEVGVTPLLLGGYTRISGMEGDVDEDLLKRAIGVLASRGRVSASELAAELSCSGEDALDALVMLGDWGSAVPYYDEAKGESPAQKTYPETWELSARDEAGLTIYDKGHQLPLTSPAASAGARPDLAAKDNFFESEKEKTYLGKGFLPRVIMLFAGPLVNLITGIVLLVLAFSGAGALTYSGDGRVGEVDAGSLAEQAGLVAGDTIVRVADVDIEAWDDLTEALQKAFSSESFELVYLHDGQTKSTTLTIDPSNPPQKLGITNYAEHRRLGVGESLSLAFNYIGTTIGFAIQLINPTQTLHIMDNSSSLVGVSVMASEAAQMGFSTLARFAALISFSLGIMNLLPIPPLDGGKILIEIIQVIIRRPISTRIQNVVSYVGLAFFLFLFVYVSRLDIIRFVLN
ncbi:MAG: site-2 protease family protein [Atopobiaceae bacterium]|nr:site-2 protease family protein [Atopobiaceae bacterium]